MRQSRANESKLECNLRRANDRRSKSSKRASETEQETVEHRAQVTGSVRLKGALANETEQETIEH